MQSSATRKAIDYTSYGLSELQFEMLKTKKNNENKYNLSQKGASFRSLDICVISGLLEFLSHLKLILIYDFVNIT
jgi:hypothetical protein